MTEHAGEGGAGGSGARRLRAAGADVLVSLGVVALSLGAVLSVARRGIFEADAFADRLARSLEDPRVAAFVADRMATAAVKQQPDLTAFRPLIVGAARGTVSSASFQTLVRTAARTAHASVFSEGGRTLIVSVPDVGVLLRSALEKANPALAEKVPARVQGVVASIGQSRLDRTVIRLFDLSRRSRRLAAALGFGGLSLILLGILLAPDRRRAVARVGLDLLVAGLVLYLLGPAGGALVAGLPQDELARQAATGLWEAYTATLRTWALVLGGIGLVFQAAGHSLLERFDLTGAVPWVRAWFDDPASGPWGRLVRAAVLLGVGAFGLRWPSLAASFVVVLASGLLVFVGLRQVFELVMRSLPAAEEARTEGTGTIRRAGRRAVVVLGLATLVAGAIAWVGRPRPAPVAFAPEACNGAPELCGRRLDAVVLPGTHNAMSAADIPDWLFPQQERGIPVQLQDGVRALLLDVHYGVPVEGRVKTDLQAETTSRAKLEEAVGTEGFEAAMRIRDRLAGKEEGPRALYLCHGFCELGASPLVETLRRIHEFLAQNPNEVLVLVVEDYVTAADLAGAFTESGLDGLVYRGAPRPPWPTLREMIDARGRVLVLTESGRPGIPWIHPAFEVMQETPYRFKQPQEPLVCTPNRGGTAGSLFLVNNWIDTTPAPKPSNAAIVNAYEALLSRAKACEAERGRRPTVIAVDFYRTGDLFRVVRTLNGLPEPDAP